MATQNNTEAPPRVVYASGGISFRGSKYSTLQDLIAFINTGLPADQRDDVQIEVLELIKTMKDDVDDKFEKSFDYMQSLKCFETASADMETFLDNHADTVEQVVEIRARRDKKVQQSSV